MSTPTAPHSSSSSTPGRIDLAREIQRSEWKNDPKIGSDQRASLTIAKWVLLLFGALYALAFIATFVLLAWKDATFEKGSDLVKFLVQLPLPLVTLAVGYYLGDRNHPPPPRRPRR